MKRKRNTKGRLGFPSDMLEEMPGVYVKGTSEILLDGQHSLIDYSSERTVFDLSYKGMYLVIEGEGLTLRNAGIKVCEITGRISAVRYTDSKSR